MSHSFNDETGGHGGDLAAAYARWDQAAGELIDFSSNINPLGPPAGILEHLKKVLPGIVAYPTPQARELRRRLAQFFNLPEQRLLLGNGANELIHLLMILLRPRRVFVPAPSFSEYERAARLAGAVVERFSLPPGGEPDYNDLIGQLTQGDLLVFCNPNNPTGKLFKRSDLLPLIKAAEERGAQVLLDESFIPLTGSAEESLRDLELNHLWVVISLTKIWGLPGLRLGCLVGPGGEIAGISRWGDPWRVNLLAQEAGLYCLQQENYIAETLKLIAEERAYLANQIKATGAFEVFEATANFLLIRGLDPAFKVELFQADLAKMGLLVRRADNFPGLDQRYFRIAVRKRAENERLVKAIKSWLKISDAETILRQGGINNGKRLPDDPGNSFLGR